MEFKLIKRYPGGPKTLGLVVHRNGSWYESNFHTENAEHFHEGIEMIEGFPEFWQKFTKLEVPVGTTFKYMSDDENVEIYKIESTDGVNVVISWSMIHPGSIIYTVKEVNDYFRKEIWVDLKDYLTFDELEIGKVYKTSYEGQGDYVFKFGYNEWVSLKYGVIHDTTTQGVGGFTPENGFNKFYLATNEEAKLLIVRKPVHISEDGVSLYEDSDYYWVYTERTLDATGNCERYIAYKPKCKCEINFKPAKNAKIFSSEEAANEYIKRNFLGTTQDCVDLYVGDYYYILHKNSLYLTPDPIQANNPSSNIKNHEAHWCFSSKQRAIEYVELQKPQYSMKDILNARPTSAEAVRNFKVLYIDLDKLKK